MNLKEIDKNKLRQVQVWKVLILRRLDKLAELELLGTCKYTYSLSFRGRNHCPVLLRDNEIIARGIVNINDTLKLIEKWEGITK